MTEPAKTHQSNQSNEAEAVAPSFATENNEPERGHSDTEPGERVKCGHTKLEIIGFLVAMLAMCATGWQAYVANDTEKRQLRAYLYISHGPITVTDNTASAEIYISHSGQTPAYKIKLVGDISVGHFPLPETEQLSLPTSGNPTYEFGALYGPEPIKQKIAMPMNSNDAIEIQKRSRDRLAGGLQVFYLFGRVRYLDIFGREWPYDFCFSFDPLGNAQGSERGCEKYNKPG